MEQEEIDTLARSIRLVAALGASRSPYVPVNDEVSKLRAKLDVVAGDLFMLRKAIEYGNPKAELLQRIHDAVEAIKE